MSVTLDTTHNHRVMSVMLDTTHTSQGDERHFGHNKHIRHRVMSVTLDTTKTHIRHRVMSATLDATISPTCIKTCTFFKQWVFHRTLDENICMCFEEHMVQRREA